MAWVDTRDAMKAYELSVQDNISTTDLKIWRDAMELLMIWRPELVRLSDWPLQRASGGEVFLSWLRKVALPDWRKVRMRTCLVKWADWLIEQGVLRVNPFRCCTFIGTLKARHWRLLKKSDIRKIIETAETGTQLEIGMGLAIMLMYMHDYTAKELRDLRWRHIAFHRKSTIIRYDGRGRRDALHPVCAGLLKRLRGVGSGLIEMSEEPVIPIPGSLMTAKALRKQMRSVFPKVLGWNGFGSIAIRESAVFHAAEAGCPWSVVVARYGRTGVRILIRAYHESKLVRQHVRQCLEDTPLWRMADTILRDIT